MAAIDDALGRYNQSNFDVSATAALVRQLGAQYSLTEDQLAAAVPVYGDEHRAQYSSGYTEGSNYQGIALRAVEDALVRKGQSAAVVAQQNPNFYAVGAGQANERWKATQENDGILGGLGIVAQIAALFPGPQQPFLLAASAANAASQGNIVGAALNAFGAYQVGFSSFAPDGSAIDLSTSDIGIGQATGSAVGGETFTVPSVLTSGNGGIDDGALQVILNSPDAVSVGSVAKAVAAVADVGSKSPGLFGSLLTGAATTAASALIKNALAPKAPTVAPAAVASGAADGGLGGPLLLALGAAILYKMAA